MRFLDSSLLVDFLQDKRDHHADAVAYIEDNSNRAFGAPTPVMFEIYRHAAWTGDHSQLKTTIDALDWVERVPFDDAAAREAAMIEAELMASGTPINKMDVLIAGSARKAGAPIVTRDGDFEKADGLETIRY